MPANEIADLEDTKFLRKEAGYTQKRAAQLAGVSIRTWRRYENEGAPPVVIRWLRAECGMVPGWPHGWQTHPQGVFVPGIGVVPFGVIESGGYALTLLQQNQRDQVISYVEQQEKQREAAANQGSNVVRMKQSA